jgi:hypothetical protein
MIEWVEEALAPTGGPLAGAKGPLSCRTWAKQPQSRRLQLLTGRRPRRRGCGRSESYVGRRSPRRYGTASDAIAPRAVMNHFIRPPRAKAAADGRLRAEVTGCGRAGPGH